MPRLQQIRDNLTDRLREAREQGWLGEVDAVEASLAAADQKLAAMRQLAAADAVDLGMPGIRRDAGRASPESRTTAPEPAAPGQDGDLDPTRLPRQATP